ncbi:MAG: NYN domain-containing protein [Actinomycetes bacterium]
MRSYCGVYVDAGYLMAAASIRETGSSYRAATHVDVAGLLRALSAQAATHSALPLLRMHWYDAGARGVASAEQRQIATLPRVKLRLGRTSIHGEQKGVDLKLALDLITQARNRVTDVVYLVSGDDDLTEAVEEAQHLGTQVVLLAIPDRDGRPINVSRNLQMACDELLLVDETALDAHVERATPAEPAVAGEEPTGAVPEQDRRDAPPARPTPALLAALAEHRAPAATPPRRLVARSSVPVYSSSTGQSTAAHDELDDDVERAVTTVVENLLTSWWGSASVAAREAVLAGRPIIPQDLDRSLLLDLSAKLGVEELEPAARFRLREVFWERAEKL